MKAKPVPTQFGLVDPQTAKDLTGIELLRGIIDGRFPAPPIFKTLNFYLAEIEPGRAVFTGTPGFEVYNPLGVVHGGYASAILDSAMALAILSKQPAGQAFTTLELKVNFVRPLFVNTGEVRAEGTVIHFGKRTATAEARLLDQQRKLYAHATCTCLIVES